MKSVLLALSVAAGVSSQAASYNGDLLIGFTLQSGNDLTYDLGSFGSLTNGQTWDLNTLLGPLNTSTVKWGVIGSEYLLSGGSAYTTKASGLPTTLTATKANNQDLSIQGIFSLFAASGAGSSVSGSSLLANSWNKQTTATSPTTTYAARWENPNATGYGATFLYGATGDSSAASVLGSFNFGNDGVVTFNAVAVPEPATCGTLAVAVLIIVSLRKQLARKQA